VALAFVVIAGLGMTLGAIFWHGEGRPGLGRPNGGPRDGGPFPGVAIVIGLAALAGTGLAYRRLAGPVGELLEAADRVGAGEYDQRLQPRGPREVQSLMRTFNDMSGRLEAADAARRQFLADVTHELRTPLAVLQSGIEAQLDGIHPRDDAHLTSLLDETHVLTRVVEDLHTLALAGAGRLTLHRESLDAVTAVADALTGHAAAARAREVTLVGPTPVPSGVAVDADPVRLQQILGNLLSNAVRHTPSGGTVQLAVDPPGPFPLCSTASPRRRARPAAGSAWRSPATSSSPMAAPSRRPTNRAAAPWCRSGSRPATTPTANSHGVPWTFTNRRRTRNAATPRVRSHDRDPAADRLRRPSG
jgi:HAMP domain-containing protein